MALRSLLLVVAIFGVGSVALVAQSKYTDDTDKFLKLTKSAPAMYVAGDKTLAAAQAHALLEMAPAFRKDWNYGNAVHTAHLVLGRIAADAGDMKEAREHLYRSVTSLPYAFDSSITQTQPWEEPFPKLAHKASPQMDTFGPDMSFARFLLEKGEKETVLKYLGYCERFWTLGGEQLTQWRKQINAGEIPNFGPNMNYFFPTTTSSQ